jgi:hypothetical protein
MIGNLIVNDWFCEKTKPIIEWRRYITKTTDTYYPSIDEKFPNFVDHVTVKKIDTTNSWWFFFEDEYELYSIHLNMYGQSRKFREFSNMEAAMNHVDDFILKLSKLKAFL